MFYYRIIDVAGVATPLTKSAQVVVNSEYLWRSISACEVFRANTNRYLELAVEFYRNDLPGREQVEVAGSTLVAFKVASAG